MSGRMRWGDFDTQHVSVWSDYLQTQGGMDAIHGEHLALQLNGKLANPQWVHNGLQKVSKKFYNNTPVKVEFYPIGIKNWCDANDYECRSHLTNVDYTYDYDIQYRSYTFFLLGQLVMLYRKPIRVESVLSNIDAKTEMGYTYIKTLHETITYTRDFIEDDLTRAEARRLQWLVTNLGCDESTISAYSPTQGNQRCRRSKRQSSQ